MKLVPRPDVSFLLDADPVQARARKPEYPLDFLFTCRESYMALNQLIGRMTIVPPMATADVSRKVLEHVLAKLSREERGSGGLKVIQEADESGLAPS
jgi:hypothetical protein